MVTRGYDFIRSRTEKNAAAIARSLRLQLRAGGRFLEIGAGLHSLLAIDERVRHAENGGHHGPRLRIPNVAVILNDGRIDFHVSIRNVHVSSRRLGRNQFDLHFASE
jgi:hypothetical protein